MSPAQVSVHSAVVTTPPVVAIDQRKGDKPVVGVGAGLSPFTTCRSPDRLHATGPTVTGSTRLPQPGQGIAVTMASLPAMSVPADPAIPLTTPTSTGVPWSWTTSPAPRLAGSNLQADR
jgi:hypothetical protein